MADNSERQGVERRGVERPADVTRPPLPEPLPVEVLDAHCHLDLQDEAVEQAIGEAASVGVTTLITIGVDVPSSRWSAETAAVHDGVWATAAIHPNEAPTASDDDIDAIARLAVLAPVVGIGETGLDHFRTPPEGRPRQEESFRRHIQIAKDAGKALVIHDRDAHQDVLRVLREEGAPEQTVFHCFSGDAKLAAQCARLGYVMSFAGNVTFKNAQPLRDALQVAPLELLLVETDAPFLTPMPHRGRPNASYLIPTTLRAMAEVKGVALDTLCTAVAENGKRVFGLA
ncbi:MAG: TatD DNase family protein [Frankiales bacterium]|nr:TatD DNase family protein [Frankiales bacterium]